MAIPITRGSPTQKPSRGILANKSHSLFKNLIGAWIFNELGGESVFDHSGNNNHLSSFGVTGWQGLGGFTDGNNGVWWAPDNELWTPSELTVIVKYKPLAIITSGAEGIVSHYNGDSGNQRSWSLSHDRTAPYLQVELSNTGSFQSGFTTLGTTVVSVNDIVTAAFTWDGNQTKVYRDGVLENTNTSAPSSLHNSTTELKFGMTFRDFDGNNNEHLRAEFEYAYIFDRALSDEEIELIYRNPYAVFQQRRILPSVGPVTRTVTTDLDAILFTPSVTYTVDTDLDSILKAINQLQITDLDAQLFKKFDISTNFDSVLRKVFELFTDLDSVLLKSQSVQTQLDSILKRTLTQQTTLDGILAGRGFQVNFLDSILELVSEIQTDLDAILGQSNEVATNLDAFLLEGGTLVTVFDAVIQRLNREIFVALDAILEIRGELTTNLDAVISKTISGQVDLDAILFGLVEQTTNLDSKLYKIGVTHRTWLHALLQLTSILQVNLDANLVAALNTRFCFIDGVLLDLDRELSINLDAILGEGIRYPHECFVAEGRDYFKAEKRESFIALPDTCKDRRRAV